MVFTVFDKEAGCAKGDHAWEPIAPEPGRPGFTRYHCRVCGDSKAMNTVGDEDPHSALLARVDNLEEVVRHLQEKFSHDALNLDELDRTVTAALALVDETTGECMVDFPDNAWGVAARGILAAAPALIAAARERDALKANSVSRLPTIDP